MDEVDGFLADLARWTGEHRTDAAARSRTRERWLRQQAVEDARFTGLLVDLAEQGVEVALGTTAGPVRGRVMAVADDFVMVASDGGRAAFVRLDAVATVRPEPGARHEEAAADRGPPAGAKLADVLAGLAAERPRVTLVTAGTPVPLTGELRAVGADVVSLRLDGRPPATVYVRMGAVNQVTVL
ncbi:MAG: DUF2642 domain-containing protein [Acidimicrobiales bacterium]